MTQQLFSKINLSKDLFYVSELSKLIRTLLRLILAKKRFSEQTATEVTTETIEK